MGRSLARRSLVRLSPLAPWLLTACSAPPDVETPASQVERWAPGVVYETARGANDRGLFDRRGLIHAHSVYSHDACDGEPVKDGVRDPDCFEDFRRGLCQSQHDFVMLTDHRNAFVDTELPEALLYREARGDELVERQGMPVASWAACEDGRRSLILAGNESGLMPVGLERHPVPREERDALYDARDEDAAAKLREAGAVILLAHTEDFTADELLEMPLDGFEMYNLHANAMLAGGTILEMLIRNRDGDPGMPHPDLAGLFIFSEDPRYLDTWAGVIARGGRPVTTVGTDCHRNTFPALLSDGERVDSYRRMMLWLSNHLLIRPEPDGSWDDRHLKDALKQGRLYGAFEMFGYPAGFDSFAEAAGGTVEMGGEVSLSDAPELVVRRPSVQNEDPAGEPAEVTLVLYRASLEGWQEVVRGQGEELRFAPEQPGAYRAEARILPRHLIPHLGDDRERILAEDHPWVLANPIHVVE